MPSFLGSALVRNRRRVAATLILLSSLPGCSCNEVVDPTGGGGAGASDDGSGGDGGGGNGATGGGGAGGSDSLVVLADGRKGLQAVRVEGDQLVWTEFGDGDPSADGAVMKCNTSGCGAAPTAVAAMQPFPSSLVLAGGRIYWADRTSGDTRTCPLDADCPSPGEVVTDFSPQWDIAVDDTSIYFTRGSDENGTVNKCPLTGCVASEVAPFAEAQNRPHWVVVDRGSVFWTAVGTPPDLADGRLLTCPSDGCGAAPTVLAADQTVIGHVVVDASNVYWMSRNDDGAVIQSCPRSGCSTDGPTIIAPGLPSAGHLTLDAERIYWTEIGSDPPGSKDGRVASCPLSGCSGPPHVYAVGQWMPRGIATDATSVYWVTGGDGKVLKIDK